MLLDFGKASFIGKARQQPEKVRQAIDKVRTDGVLTTLDAIGTKLDQPIPMGYCNVGVVRANGDRASDFEVGDRVVSNGPHSEFVAVPQILTTKIPDSVSDDEAAFAILGAIALQGIRLAKPTLGESVAVFGLGLIGLLAVQLLRANGCRVLGIDFNADRVRMAQTFGAETVLLSDGQDVVRAAMDFSRGRGVDAAFITTATNKDEPVSQAARMCRKRGRIVLVGTAGLSLSRDEFYKKELSFQVSCSYGPGRYDPEYEDEGHDYPFGFVRWTEQRNIEAVLDMLADGRIDVAPLISHRFKIDKAETAYEKIVGDKSALGILLEYDAPAARSADRSVPLDSAVRQAGRAAGTSGRPVVSFIGAGNYAQAVLIPAFHAAEARLQSIATVSGVNSVHAGRKHGFAEATTDVERVLADDSVDAVVITTRHDSHARLVCQAFEAGKHVFVEKPLALSLDELARISEAFERARSQHPGIVLTVGFNRRFSPYTRRAAELLARTNEPAAFVMTVNAGQIPADHWTQNQRIGGGRIVGEACHFVDLLRFLAGRKIVSHQLTALDSDTADTVTISLQFEDGSIGTINYFANGSKAFPKERLEVFCGGRVLQVDNFRKLSVYGWEGINGMRTLRQDKGQTGCVAAFLDAVENGNEAPIALEELIEVSRVSIELAQAAYGI